MKIVVLGAGVEGVTTAYYLNKSGHDVTVIDRQAASAAECSFANGGQLSYSHVEPWATPAVIPKLPKWLLDKNSPLVFYPQADINMWKWIIQFLLNCRSSKVKASTANMMRLSLYSRECMQSINEDVAIDYSHRPLGTIHTFSDEESFQRNIKHAEFQKTLGCDFQILESREACEEKEPAFKYCPADLMGGIYFPMDATGDINKFAVDMSEILRQRGVKFEYSTNILGAKYDGDKIKSIVTDKGEVSADAYIVCLGSYSSLFLRKIKINVPIYPLKGYSISIKVQDESKAPSMGITNQSDKIVFSRLGDIVRVAGTAEISGYNDSIRKKRIKTIKKMVKRYLPECGDIDNADQWACLRPATPDGSPIIGGSDYKNLFLNTGHGTLGWTMAAGSAAAICDIINNKEPDISMAGLNLERF